MADVPRAALVGPRDEFWRFSLLDLNRRLIGPLDGVVNGTFDYSIHTTIRSSGNVLYEGAERIDWTQVLVQPWYGVRYRGERYEWPLGVFMCSTPRREYWDGGEAVPVEMYDQLLVLDQDKVDSTYTVTAGTNLASAVRTAFEGGISARLVIPPDATMTAAQALLWEAGTSRLQIINELLDAMNYFALRVDGFGVFHADPYTAPAQRAPAWDFRDDHESIYAPEFAHEQDSFDVPNKVVMLGRSDGDTPAPSATATNTDPASPYSYSGRGNRWVTTVETDTDAADATVLGQIAARRLLELSQVATSFPITHAPVPLTLNDVATLANEQHDLDGVRCVVQQMRWSTGVGDLVQTTLRQVVS